MKKVIGIDLGGTKINACLIDENGEVLQRSNVVTEASKGRNIVLQNIRKSIEKLDYKDALAIGFIYIRINK